MLPQINVSSTLMQQHSHAGHSNSSDANTNLPLPNINDLNRAFPRHQRPLPPVAQRAIQVLGITQDFTNRLERPFPGSNVQRTACAGLGTTVSTLTSSLSNTALRHSRVSVRALAQAVIPRVSAFLGDHAQQSCHTVIQVLTVASAISQAVRTQISSALLPTRVEPNPPSSTANRSVSVVSPQTPAPTSTSLPQSAHQPPAMVSTPATAPTPISRLAPVREVGSTPLREPIAASATIVPSTMQQSSVTVAAPINPANSTTTTVGVVLNPVKPASAQVTVMQQVGNTMVGTSLVPLKGNKRPNISVSRAVLGFGHLGGTINVRKPLHSTLSAQVPAMILGVPVSVGLDLSLRRIKDARIHLSLPVQPLNLLLTPLGIKVPTLQIASISIKKVVNTGTKVLRSIGRFFGFGGFGTSAAEEERMRIFLEAYYRYCEEMRKKQQLLLRFPKDIEELGRLVRELQPVINAFLSAQRMQHSHFVALEVGNIQLDLSFAISDANVQEVGQAVQDFRLAEQERQATLAARPSIQDSEDKLQAAVGKLTDEVSALSLVTIPMPSQTSVEGLRQLQNEISINANQPSVTVATATASGANGVLQNNTQVVVANQNLVAAVALTASQTHKVLLDNRTTLMQKLKTTMSAEQARALRTRLAHGE